MSPFIFFTHGQRKLFGATVELDLAYRCTSCGAERLAHVVGKGSGQTQEDADARAPLDAAEMLSLATCPRCHATDAGSWRGFRRRTRITQAIATATLFAAVAALWDPDKPVVAVALAIPSVLIVFLIGYLRELRTEMPADRVSFYSPEEAAAKERAAEEQEARRAQKKRVSRARAREVARRNEDLAVAARRRFDVRFPQRKEADDEEADEVLDYVRGLLVLLARRGGRLATLREGRQLPDLRRFAETDDERAWLQTIEAEGPRPKAQHVIDVLLRLAASSRADAAESSVLTATLLEGPIEVEVRFELRPTKPPEDLKLVVEHLRDDGSAAVRASDTARS